MAPVIEPALAVLYDYLFDETESDCVVTLKFPKDFDAARLAIDLSGSIGVTVALPPPHPPIIRCRLAQPVTGLTTERTSTGLAIRLTKSTPGIWGTLASDFFPDTEDLDPKSAFLLGRAKATATPPDESGEPILNFAVDFGFVPALRYRIDAHAGKSPLPPDIAKLLERAARVYGDHESQFEYAAILEESPKTRQEALALYKLAFLGGVTAAGVALAVRLSPLSDGFPDYRKNAKKAVSLFERVIQREENPVALNGLAQLVYNGKGTPQDLTRAQALHARAKSIDSAIGELVLIDDTKWITGLFVGLGVVVAALVVTRFFVQRRRR